MKGSGQLAGPPLPACIESGVARAAVGSVRADEATPLALLCDEGCLPARCRVAWRSRSARWRESGSQEGREAEGADSGRASDSADVDW